MIPGTWKSEWKGPKFQTSLDNTQNRNAFSTNHPKRCRQDTPLSGEKIHIPLCEQLRYNLSVHGHQPSATSHQPPAACPGCLTPTAPDTTSWFQEEARGVLTSHRRPASPITRESLAKPSSPPLPCTPRTGQSQGACPCVAPGTETQAEIRTTLQSISMPPGTLVTTTTTGSTSCVHAESAQS